MFSSKTMRLLDFAIEAGFEEDCVMQQFDRYVNKYLDGDTSLVDENSESHGPRFIEFIQKSLSEGESSKTLPRVDRKRKDIPHDSDSDDDSMGELELRMQAMAMAPLTAREEKMDELTFAAWKVFGIKSFRQNQKEIITSVLDGHDTFVLMPTGGGKSLCYQLPAVLSRGMTVVISPLLSLVQDQVKTLVTLPCGGVPATYLNSTQQMNERRAVYREISMEELTCKLLYVTPEQLTSNPTLIEILRKQQKQKNFQRLIVDEAHCVSTWGHDFRPAYADLERVKSELFPGVQIVALTATANENVKNDVLQMLRIHSSAKEFKTSFYRSNLKFIVAEATNFFKKLAMLKKYIRQQQRNVSGIIYCLSKKECEQVAAYLNAVRISSAHYHAGMTSTARESVQNDWKKGIIVVVVATIAFGMGIDNAHVRYVIHFVIPKSLEGYYQEAGRAGRDGLRSECVMLFSKRDVFRLKNLVRFGNDDFAKDYELIEKVRSYCLDEDSCRHALLLDYLGERLVPSRCGSNCHVCCSLNGGPSLEEQCPWSLPDPKEITMAKNLATDIQDQDDLKT